MPWKYIVIILFEIFGIYPNANKMYISKTIVNKHFSVLRLTLIRKDNQNLITPIRENRNKWDRDIKLRFIIRLQL